MKALLCLLSILAASCAISIPDQFIAQFDIWGQYNASFLLNGAPYNEPYLYTPPVNALSGTIYFDWQKQGLRVEWTNGDGAPYTLSSTTIVHSYDFKDGMKTFNVTSDVYQYVSDGRCYLYPGYEHEEPYDITQLDPNATYAGVKEINGVQCFVLADPQGNTFAFQLSDLSPVQFSTQGDLFQAFPFFGQLGSQENASTWINFRNVKLGPVDAKYFAPPTGKCYTYHYPELKAVANLFKKTLTAKKEAPVKSDSRVNRSDKKKVRVVEERQIVPTLAQAFSATYNWWINSSDLPAQFTLSGQLGFDFMKSGFFLEFDTEGGTLPINFQTTLVVYPDRNGIELLQTNGNNCYSYLFIQYLFTYLIPQFEVPFDAVFSGNVVFNGDPCTIWQLPDWYFGSPALYIRNSDSMIVKIVTTEQSSGIGSVLVFTNIQPTVDPSKYARPSVCTDTMTWNPAFVSHLPWDWCDPYCY